MRWSNVGGDFQLIQSSSEVVGRPLAALLANDGARVLSVDVDCTSFLLSLLDIRPSLLAILIPRTSDFTKPR